jgi:prolyl oligopeptidase
VHFKAAVLVAVLSATGCAGTALRGPAPHEMTGHAGANMSTAVGEQRAAIAALRYPAARIADVVDDYHGIRVADPYRWMEDLADPETRAWAAVQNALIDSHLAGDPLREEVRARLTVMHDRLDNFSIALPSQHAAGREFFMQTNAGGAALYVRSAVGAAPRLLVEPASFPADAALSGFWVAPDGRNVAYTLSYGGGEWVELRVRNVDTGIDQPEILQGLIFPSVAWTRDSRGIFYTRSQMPGAGELAAARNAAVHYHRPGTEQARDQLIFSTVPGTTNVVLSVAISEDGGYAFIYEGSGSYQGALGWALTRMHFLDLEHGERPDLAARPVALNAQQDAAYNVVWSDGPVAYVLTTRDAPRHRLVAIDLRDPAVERWRDVIPQTEGVLQSVHRVGGRWVAAYLENVHSVLRVFTHDGASRGEIVLPTLGSVFAISGDPSAPEVTFTFSSFTHPDAVLRHDLDAGSTTVLRRLDNGFEGGGYETRQLWFAARDGTRIPMFVVHRRDITLDGSNATMLYGYGSSGTSLLPEFSEGVAMWLEMGGVYAVANIRGGGEFGQAWYEAAILDRKQTSFDDFVAAAEHLIRSGYTTSQRLAIHGHSFGGLLVGAVMTQRPDLFAAAIAENAVLDMLRRDPGRHAAQYGSATDPVQFPHLFAYSPLHAVRPGTCYPATFSGTALNDDRVAAWQAWKFTAVLQAAQSCPRPVVLRTAEAGGHAGSRDDAELMADILTFAARNTRLPGAVPDSAARSLPAR